MATKRTLRATMALAAGATIWLAGAGAAQATEWRVADAAAAGFTFMDMHAVKRTGNKVQFATWTIKINKADNGIDNWKVVSVADCDRFSYRDVRVEYFAGAGFVERSESEPELSAAPDTMAYSKVAVACGRKTASADIVADPYALVQEHVRRSLL